MIIIIPKANVIFSCKCPLLGTIIQSKCGTHKEDFLQFLLHLGFDGSSNNVLWTILSHKIVIIKPAEHRLWTYKEDTVPQFGGGTEGEGLQKRSDPKCNQRYEPAQSHLKLAVWLIFLRECVKVLSQWQMTSERSRKWCVGVLVNEGIRTFQTEGLPAPEITPLSWPRRLQTSRTFWREVVSEKEL